MARLGTKPTPNKLQYEDHPEVASRQKVTFEEANYLIDKAINPGISSSFSTDVMADDEIYFGNYDQGEVLNFAKDLSVQNNIGQGNGMHGTITVDGVNDITFSSDFLMISNEFNLLGDPPSPGDIYILTAVWNGTKFSTSFTKEV